MISELQPEKTDFIITKKEDDHWYITHNNLEAGPFKTIPDHINTKEFDKICDYFQIPNQQQSKLARTLLKKRLIEQSDIPEKTFEKLTKKEYMTIILKEITKKYFFVTPEDIETLYYYKNGVYIPCETQIKSFIEAIIEDETNINFCNEVIAHLKRRSYKKRSEFNKNKNCLPVKNGVLNLTTYELEPHDPKKIFTYKINIKYNPDKTCPKFNKFITEILPDRTSDQKLLQEYAGYTLHGQFPYHNFMLLVGSGRNGKGAYIRSLQGIIGNAHVSNVPLEQLSGGHRFSIVRLYGKLMNVCSEPKTSEKYPFKTELFKSITGQDTLHGEIKNKQKTLDFVSFAKFYIQANKLPRVDDKTLSFWDRVLIINFTEQFTDEKNNRIVNVEDTWLNDSTERSGILNWMINGLKRLQKNNQFTKTKTMREQILLFQQLSDPTAAFFGEKCIFSLNYMIIIGDFYNEFKNYCEDLDIQADSKRTFFKRVRELPRVKDDRRKIQGKTRDVFVGVNIQGSLVEEIEPIQILLKKSENTEESDLGEPSEPFG